MSDPFAPYYYDEEEYDLDKFINDYRDVLNTHQPEFFSNTRGEIKEETFKDPTKENPESELFALPIGLSNKDIFGQDGIPKELFKTMNKKDVAGALRASNPKMYNNFSDDDLIAMGRQGGIDVDNLIYNDNPESFSIMGNALYSFWQQSNVKPYMKANWAAFNMELQDEAQGKIDPETGERVVAANPLTAALSFPGKAYEMLTGEKINWNEVKAQAIREQAEGRQKWKEIIKNDPEVRGYLRWKQDNELDWNNWYDPNKLTDIAFNTLPSWVAVLGTGAAATVLTRGKSLYAPRMTMMAVTGLMEGSSVSDEMIEDLMKDVPVSNEEVKADIDDYRESLLQQLNTPDYKGINYINEDDRYDVYDTVTFQGVNYKWSEMPEVKKKEFLEKQTNDFVSRKFVNKNGKMFKKGLSLEDAFDAANLGSLAHGAIAGAIEVLPGVEMSLLKKSGLLNPVQKMAGFRLFKNTDNFANILYKLPKGFKGPNSRAAMSSLKGGIFEGLEEIGQYGSQIFTTTTLPYKDPDTGGWRYGTSRESFGEKWNWSEAMEGFLGGFMIGGGTGISLSGAKGLATYTGVAQSFENYRTSANKSNDSIYVVKTKDGKYGFARHTEKEDGTVEDKKLTREDLEDFVDESYDTFADAFGVAKVMNEAIEKDKQRILWGKFGKYHESDFTIETDDKGKKSIVWMNSSGEIFEQTPLSELGEKGLSEKEASKRANEIKDNVAGLYRNLGDDYSIKQSGFKQDSQGNPVWDAPYGEKDFKIQVNKDGTMVLNDSGLPILKQGGKTVEASRLSKEEQAKAISDLESAGQGGFVSALKNLFKSKPKQQKVSPIVSDTGQTTDQEIIQEEEPVVEIKDSKLNTRLKVRGFLGEDVADNDVETVKNLEDEGVFSDYDEMIKGVEDEYASTKDFEEGTGVSFETFANEINLAFPDKPSITEDIFLKEQQQEEEFIKQQTANQEPPEPTPVKTKAKSKGKSKYAKMSTEELNKLLAEKEETLKNTDKEGGKALLNITIKAIKKELDTRQAPIKKRVVQPQDIRNLMLREEYLEMEIDKLQKESEIYPDDPNNIPALNSAIAELAAVKEEIKNIKNIQSRTLVKPKSKAEATKDEVVKIVESLSEKFNILGGKTDSIKVVLFDENDVKHVEYFLNNNIDANTDVGWYDRNTKTIYLNPELIAKKALDTPFHEFMHPFIGQMAKTNPQLFNSLYNDLVKLKDEGDKFATEVFDQVSDKAYERLSEQGRKEEIIVTAIGFAAKNSHLKKVKDNEGIKGWLKRLFNWFKEKLFGKATVYVRPWDLNENTTISELSEMLADLDGIYKFELVSDEVLQDIDNEIQKQSKMENVDKNELPVSEEINIESLDKLEGLDWVNANTQLIIEVKELMGEFVANVFDGSKKMRQFLLEQPEINEATIKKAIKKYTKEFVNNFEKILEAKFKIPKGPYKPRATRTKKRMSQRAKELSENLQGRVAIALTDSLLRGRARYANKVKTDNLIEFAGKTIKQDLDRLGQKIEDYIELVKFNYGFLKILENKTGKFAISDLKKDKISGQSLKKAEQEILQNEFVPFLEKNFKGIKSIGVEELRIEYTNFMNVNYGIHKFKGIGYTGSLRMDYIYGNNADQDYNIEEFRYILSNQGFYTSGHRFSVVPLNSNEEGKSLFQEANGMGWYTINTLKNDDGTTDIIGFEFQTDILDDLKTISKATNNFGEMEVDMTEINVDPYYGALSTLWRTSLRDSYEKNEIKANDYLYRERQGPELYFTIVLDLMNNVLGGQLQNNEIRLLINALDYQKELLTPDGTAREVAEPIYPWKDTNSKLKDYKLVHSLQIASDQVSYAQKDVDAIVESFNKDKTILVNFVDSSFGYLKKPIIMSDFASRFNQSLSYFRQRRLLIDRAELLDRQYVNNVVKVIYGIINGNSKEDRLVLHNIFKEIRDQINNTTDEQANYSQLPALKKLLALPAIQNALKHAQTSSLGLQNVDNKNLLRMLGFEETNIMHSQDLRYRAKKSDVHFHGQASEFTVADGFFGMRENRLVQIGFDLNSFIMQYYFYDGETNRGNLILEDGTKNPKRFKNKDTFVGMAFGAEMPPIATLPFFYLNQAFYRRTKAEQNFITKQQKVVQNFTQHIIPLILSAANSTDISILDKVANLTELRDEIGEKNFANFENVISDYILNSISSNMSDAFRHYSYMLSHTRRRFKDTFAPGKVKLEGDKLVTPKDWANMLNMSEEELNLNRNWANHFNTWFDKVIRLWMLDAQKYNGDNFLMTGFTTRLVEGNDASAMLYLTSDESNLLNVFTLINENFLEQDKDSQVTVDIEPAFTDADISSKLSPESAEFYRFLKDSYDNYIGTTKGTLSPSEGRFSSYPLAPNNILQTLSLMYRDDFHMQYRIYDFATISDEASTQEITKDFFNRLSKLSKELKTFVEFNYKPGAFFTALMKVAKKENVKLSYDKLQNVTNGPVMIKVDLSDTKSESLKPLYFRKIKNEQLSLDFPVTEEAVLDKVDDYIRDFHNANIMDAQEMFNNILKDFKLVMRNRYGVNVLDSELFKMAMMNQLNKNPQLLEQYIDWHDSKFANEKVTKKSKKLGKNDSETDMYDDIADDYNYSLTEIFEDFKELGRFDDVIKGNNSNENYYNINDFSWLQELGVRITNERYNRMLRRARNSKSFADFMTSVPTLIGRTRLSGKDKKKFRKFWNRAKSNISVNSKDAQRKGWYVLKKTQYGKDAIITSVNRKGVENPIKKTTNPQWERKTILEHNEKHFPFVFEYMTRKDVYEKRPESQAQLMKGEVNQVRESYSFFNENELMQLDAVLFKEDRTIAFIRGDSKKLGIVKILPQHYKIAESKESVMLYWKNEQDNGYIPKDEDGGATMIDELANNDVVQNIARHEALKVAWPMHKFYPATTVMKRIKIPTTPGTFSDIRDFTASFFNPKTATIVYPDGSTKPLYKKIKGDVGYKYIGDGGDFVSKSFMKAYIVSNGLSNDTIEMKTSIWQKDGNNVVMFKHNSFLADEDMVIVENYGSPKQRIIAEIENGVITNENGDIIDMLSTDDEVKVFDGYNYEDVISIKGSSMVTSFYTEDKSTTASHGMQWYNYLDNGDIINALWNPNDGVMTLSIRRDLAKLYSLGIDTPGGKSMAKKIENFLNKIIGTDDDGFMATVLEHAKLGAGLHPVVSTALDKLVQTRIINPALNLKSRPGAKLIIRPNTDANIQEKEISIPMHALGPALDKIARDMNVARGEVSIDMVNQWLSTEGNMQKVLLYRTPIASIVGAGIYRIKSVHNKKNVILINEDNVFYDLEADHDADKVQLEYLDDNILDMMESYLDEVDFKRHDLKRFVPPGFDESFSMNSTRQISQVINALAAGQNGIGEIAKAASAYGVLSTWFDNMVINGRKVIMTPKDYKLTWNTYYNGTNKWTGTLPELLYIYLQASADNAEFMLLGHWKYDRNDLYRMMFKYEDDMKNINDEDLKIILELTKIARMPQNIRLGHDYNHGKYFSKQTFIESRLYDQFTNNREQELMRIVEKNQRITSVLESFETKDDLHPLEIVALLPHRTRNINEYNNHILSSGDAPLSIPTQMHINSHNDAKDIVLLESMIEEYINNAIVRDGKELLTSKEKEQYIKDEYNKALKYIVNMKNSFYGLLTKKPNYNFSSMDRDDFMIKYKEVFSKKFAKLSETAKTHATFWFLDGFNLIAPSGQSVRTKVLTVLPPVSKSSKEYSTLDWRVMSEYYRQYNTSIKDKRDVGKALETNRTKYSYKQKIGAICGRL